MFRRGQAPAPHPSADAPEWFTDALDQAPQHSTVDVDGCPIHVRTWGDSDKPPLVFWKIIDNIEKMVHKYRQ